MIDLERTRSEMLADIGANGIARREALADPGDPRFLETEARLVVRGTTPEDLLPGLNAAFTRRFDDVAGPQLVDDLLIPLKKAVGNAWKWGNGRDPAKCVEVETIVTAMGAVIAVQDQGDGFDVGDVLGRFTRDEHYFSHGGSGFVHFRKARSLVSYSDGGRTVLIRYLRRPEPGRELHAAERETLGSAADPSIVGPLLAGRLGIELDRCRVLVPQDWRQDGTELTYLLEGRDGSAATQRYTLVGRVLPPERARIDLSVAEQLLQLRFNGDRRLRIPRPVALLEAPSLAVYECSPMTNLRGALAPISDPDRSASVMRTIAVGLRVLHQSRLELPGEVPLAEMLGRPAAVGWRAIRKLSPGSRGRARRIENILKLIRDRAADIPDVDRVPVQVDFGWHRILCDGDLFHLYWFDEFRSAHPFFDIGAFVADLLRFCVLRKKARPELYRRDLDVFLETYFSGDTRSLDDLPFFVACALLLRLGRVLERPESKWKKIDPILDHCERLLGGTTL